MYQEKNSFPSLRASIPPERHLFLQGAKFAQDAGLVLSTDAKPRLKWTAELHERFIEAVNQLGGADKATPKTVMRLMGVSGMTLYHLKSHLQKYRLSKNHHANNGNNKNGCAAAEDRMSEGSRGYTSSTSIGAQTSKSLQISEAIQMQIEVQRRLHEQLEVQRHLQLRIEAQGRYLQSVLEKAQETLKRQNLGTSGLEAAKVQLSELVSRVSNECFSSDFSGIKEMPSLCSQKTQTAHMADFSMDSCLTSCEGSQKDEEIHNAGMMLRNFNSYAPTCPKDMGEDSRPEETELPWHKGLHKNTMFTSESIMFPSQHNSSDLSMTIGVQGENRSDRTISKTRSERETQEVEPPTIQPENENPGFKLSYLTGQLDLNAHDENCAASGCKKIDLNGFSWN